MTTPLTTVTPTGAIRGGVIVVQEAFGVTAHIADVCRRFADAGWIAVAPHFFHRVGDPVVEYDDLGTAMPLVYGLVGTEIDEDIDVAIASLNAAGITTARIAIVGFCMGGTVAFHTAARLPLGAASTFYGGGIIKGRFSYPPMLDIAAELQTPWLGLFGDRDRGIPVEEVESLRNALAAAEVDTSIVRYRDAQHGFHCNDRPAVYDESAAHDGWDRTVRWFESHIAPA